MEYSPMHCRARMDVFKDAIQKVDLKSKELVLLRNGVFPDLRKEQQLIEEKLIETNYPDHELSFLELCSFNTWFTLHPEKIAGEEIQTTSLQFPLTIKGDRKKIEAVISHTVSPSIISDLEMESLALEIELQLQAL